MSGIPRDDFDSLARRYWAAWGDALRSAVPGSVPGMGAIPGAGGAWAQTPGVDAWQESLDWWTRLAHGGRTQTNDALEHFNSQARQWYARMQEVAARFAGQESSATDVARAWKQALGASGENPFPEMLRSMHGHGLQGLEQWVDDASPWLDSVRDEGMSWLRLPAFGAGREQQERLQALATHVAEYQQASNAYGALMLKAQQEAFVIFETRLIDHEDPGRQIQSARALFDLWIDAAEEAYADIALSPEFREVYGRLVNAQMRVRAGVQRMVEDACAQLGMPTRSELDGAHRKLAQLEREVRKLRDAVGNGRARPPEKAAARGEAEQDVPPRPAARRASDSTAGAAKASNPASRGAAKRPAGTATSRRGSAPARTTQSAAKASSAAATMPAAKRSTAAATRPAVKRSTAAATKRAAKRSTAAATKTAAKRSTAAATRPAAKRSTAPATKPAAKRPTATATKRATRKAGGRTSAGRSFGGAIAGAMPHAPEPIASRPTKKSVKKGRR